MGDFDDAAEQRRLRRVSTANEMLLVMAVGERRLRPVREAFEREFLRPMVRSWHVRVWWRMYLQPGHPRMLLTYTPREAT